MTPSTGHRVTETSRVGSQTPADAAERSVTRSIGGHWIGRLGVGSCGLLASSGTASAHGGVGHGGPPVAIPAVLWVPIVTGLLGGVVAVRYRARSTTVTERRRTSRVLALLLIVLAGIFAATALTSGPLLGAVGGCIGALATLWIVERDRGKPRGRGHHADLTLGGVCAHRFLEGVALGALYVASAAIGVIGVAVIAGHAALETAAIGGLYAPSRLRAFAAIALVQIGYPVGALAGIGVGASIPASVQVAMIGLVAGVLLVAGVVETNHPPIALAAGGVTD